MVRPSHSTICSGSDRMAKRLPHKTEKSRAHRRPPAGSSPGVMRPNPDAHPSQFKLISYGADKVIEHDDIDHATLSKARAENPVSWINVDGLGDQGAIRNLGEEFDLHGLSLEDVTDVYQRPKADDYESLLFIVLRVPTKERRLGTEQLSLFVGQNFVLTFQETSGDCFDPVRDRIRDPRSRLRANGPDFLAYTLIDAVIDSFFPILEDLGEQLEDLEQDIMEDPRHEHIPLIHTIRRDMLIVRRAVWPLRELINGLLRDDHPNIDAKTQLFLRDCYDHTVQIMDMVDTNREIIGGLIDMHLSAVSNRMNEIMKVLTVIATIFMPLSFIASVYGMNFDPSKSPWNMPELDWRYGYPAVIALMLSVSGGMLLYFRRKGWLGGKRASQAHHRVTRYENQDANDRDVH